jgi:hypothetical protein
MSHVWATCCEARPLALGFQGTFHQPSRQVKRLAQKMAAFCNAFKDLEFVLEGENTTVEWIDGFRQTFEECDEFLSDFQSLQAGQGFEKRPTGFPKLPYKMGSYMYTDTEIANLEARVDIQLNIMNAKMDDVAL